MKIGFLGLGKLGLPCALAIESKGHQISGYDINNKVREIVTTRKLPYREEGAQKLLEKSKIGFLELSDLVSFSEIIVFW